MKYLFNYDKDKVNNFLVVYLTSHEHVKIITKDIIIISTRKQSRVHVMREKGAWYSVTVKKLLSQI